jgi:hypothetical protein
LFSVMIICSSVFVLCFLLCCVVGGGAVDI